MFHRKQHRLMRRWNARNGNTLVNDSPPQMSDRTRYCGTSSEPDNHSVFNQFGD
jgi:hypothetical protein